MGRREMTALNYAELGAKTLMDKFKPDELPPTDRFHYHQGVYLAGVERVYHLTGEREYYDYIKAWADHNIDEDGNCMGCHLDEFDDIQPAILLFNLYKTTGDERYKKVMDTCATATLQWPLNSFGAVWHKYHFPNQMWLDCMYMMGLFSSMYAKEFDCPKLFDMVYDLMRGMRGHMVNPETGLMYHMYDDSKKANFINPQTGAVEVHWGRAMGWFVVAIIEILDYLPSDYSHRQEFIDAELSLLNALLKYQDKETGLWYQVVDKVDDKRNWFETSCSALYTYALAKCMRVGLVDKSYKDILIKAYEGVLSKVSVEEDGIFVSDVCIGTGFGDLEFYFARPTVINDLHGMGAFLLMCTEVYAALNE